MAGLALIAGCAGPSDVEVADAPAADDLSRDRAEACTDLLRALPSSLEDQERREVSPEAALAAVWGDPAIVLRCGVPEPAEFELASPCLSVDGVDWFVPGDELQAPEGPEVLLYVVERLVTIEVTLPVEYGPPAALLADLSAPVQQQVPATGRCR